MMMMQNVKDEEGLVLSGEVNAAMLRRSQHRSVTETFSVCWLILKAEINLRENMVRCETRQVAYTTATTVRTSYSGYILKLN